jgi:tetratricopeptide (TPR) repeat protein
MSVDRKKPSELLDMAFKAYDSGHLEQALDLVEQAIEGNPKHWYLWATKARYLEELGRFEESKTAFKGSIDLNNNQAITWSMLAGLYYDEENFQDCAHCCRSALEIEENYTTLTILAGAEIQTGEIENALKHANRALELNPDWDEAESMRDQALRILARAE